MNRLARVLLSIFLANRTINVEDVKKDIENNTTNTDYTPEIELPPPQQEDVDLTGEYDPLKETSVVFSPLSEDVKFFNLYKTESQDEFLLERSELNIHDVTETMALVSGAGYELKIIFDHVQADPRNYRLRLYKVQGYLVLGVNRLDNHSNDWYYCTLLELPEGRFNPIILTVKKSPKTAIKQNLEYWVDHSRPSDGGNK